MPYRYICRYTDGTATVIYAYDAESARRAAYRTAGSRVVGEVVR